MNSSTSSSDWRRFCRAFVLAGGGVLLVLYLFVALVDPWDALPLSPPLPRVPISTNARFSFPALARSPDFDSAVFGTSTARALRPARLDAAFGGARFANLAMNSATPWEQVQLLHVFLRAHPHPHAMVIDLDEGWCGASVPQLTAREFPGWMYAASRWAAYGHILTPYAVQEAANQFATMLGWKRRRYGLDGYTRFTPPDAEYDPARVDAAFARWPAPDGRPAEPGSPVELAALPLLQDALQAIPPATRTILFLPPIHVSQHGTPGSEAALRWATCKAQVTALAARHGATVLDFLYNSPLTDARANFWDPLHARDRVADRVADLLAAPDGPDVRRLTSDD